MISKIKSWIIGKVLVKKVFGKFAKHGAGALIGLISSPAVAPWVEKMGISVDSAQMEAGLIIVMIGLFGAAWNFVEHRFIKK